MRKPGYCRKRWVVADYDKQKAVQMAAECDLDEVLTLILTARGYSDPFEIDEFVSCDAPLLEPELLPGMADAVRRITAAADAFEKIAVYGDYDADGVTATAILYSYLQSRDCDVIFYIPDRSEEGYGMNLASLEKLKAEGVSLIITVDNGISAKNEVAYAKSLGMDVVITDHHLPPDELPEAAAVVNPHLPGYGYPFPDICGAMVAFKLVCALEGAECEELLPLYGDLVALATATDIMPLVGENRIAVRRGLRILRASPRPGPEALMRESGIDPRRADASSLGFVLGPRINAAGRMGRSERAVRLLLSTDPEECADIAKELCEENARRQKVEAEILALALEEIRSSDLMYDPVPVVAGENWHPGVVGIVASRLTELLGRPSVVLSIDGDTASGSGRSIRGFHLHEAFCAAADLLTVFGGHELAGGLTLKTENIPAFRRRINEYAAKREMPRPELRLDCKVNPRFMNLDVLYALSPLEPYGHANPRPVFGLFGMRLDAAVPLKNGKHLRLDVSRDGASVKVLCFGLTPEEFPYLPGDTVDLAVTMEESEFRGERSVCVKLVDIRPSGGDEAAELAGIREYEAFRRGETAPETLSFPPPTRDDTAAVYRALRTLGRPVIHYEVLAGRLKMPTAKLRIILDILGELNLIRLNPLSPACAEFMLCAVEGKVDLMQSALLRALTNGR